MVVCQQSDDLLFFQSSRKKTEDTNNIGYIGKISEPDTLRWRTGFSEHESIGFVGIIHVEINTGLLRTITSLLARSRNKLWKSFRMKILRQKKDETGSLLSCGGGIRCTFGRRCCCDDDRGNRLWGACCHVLLKLLRRNSLDANLNKFQPSITYIISLVVCKWEDGLFQIEHLYYSLFWQYSLIKMC